MSNFKAIDAFCGAGGLSLGLIQAGFEVVFSFDNDPICIGTLNANKKYHKNHFRHKNVKDLLNGEILKETNLLRGSLDLLAGGPPCQGFSIQRTQGGDNDDRNLLVDDYGDLIIELLPKVFLLENVPGIGGKRGKEILEKFKNKMLLHNYECYEKILNAKDYGVPQRRKRYILVGIQKICNINFSWPHKNNNQTKTVRECIAHLPPAPNDGSTHPDYPMHRADKLSTKNLERIRTIVAGQAREDLPEKLLTNCHRLSSSKIGHRNVYGRMVWDDVSPTITAKFDSFTRGKFGHPEQDRSISLLEGSLLQTFPEDYIFLGNKVEAARQIGNAVPPLMGKAIGLAIIRALKNEL